MKSKKKNWIHIISQQKKSLKWLYFERVCDWNEKLNWLEHNWWKKSDREKIKDGQVKSKISWNRISLWEKV